MMSRRISTAICAAGCSGMIAQMILLRELLIVFSGNELSIGIILASWLILEAFGSFYIGKRAERSKHLLAVYAGMNILFSAALPAMVYITRILRIMLGLSIGEGIGILPILYSSFFILLPISVLHGALFTFGCKVYSAYSKPDASSVGRAYVYETLGTIIGGIVWTFLIIPYVHTMHAAIWLSVAHLAIGVLVLAQYLRIGPKIERAAAGIAVVLLGAGVLTASGGLADVLHQRSIETQWAPQNLVHYQNSRYSNISVTELEGQYTFFLDGIPHMKTPIPDILFVEEFVHLPLMAHPNPERLLILSGGAGGVINEVLKHHSVQSVEYAELDPMILELVDRYSTSLTERELKDERVHITHSDGRLFLKTTQKTYDVLLVGIRELTDLQTNRFFTQEFFSLADKTLNADGILVFSIPGSLTYFSDELRSLNASVYHTVKEVFPHVRVIPGDEANLYLVSHAGDIMEMDVSLFAQRVLERDFTPDVLVPRHIQNKLHPGWAGWYEEFIEGKSHVLNSDFRPIGVYYSIAHWNALHTPALQGLFAWFGNLTLRSIAVPFAAGIALLILLRIKKPTIFGSGVPWTIGTTGFAGMVFDLALIFAFQALYGYVFAWIGLLITCFMVGSACGAMAVTVLLPRIKDAARAFIAIDLVIIMYALVLPLLFLMLQPYMDRPAMFSAMRAVILLLSFVSGLLISAQFPLANHIYLRSNNNLSRTVGLLYGSDLVGGWIGGILGGVALLPVLGLFGTCAAAVLLKACSFVMLTVGRKTAV